MEQGPSKPTHPSQSEYSQYSSDPIPRPQNDFSPPRTDRPNSPVSLMPSTSHPGFTPGSITPSFTTSVSTSSSTDTSNLQSSLPPGSYAIVQPVNGEYSSIVQGTTMPSAASADSDPQVIEALKSKDRIFVLKLGEIMEAVLNDKRPRDIHPVTSYQRMLVHRCSAYYRLSPETDSVTKLITVHLMPHSKMPMKRLSELVPAESTVQPAFKIMQIMQRDTKSKSLSQTGSAAGEEADLSDVEPSEAGSLGGKSAGSSKKRTIEERAAAYAEARSRIFMGFEEKGREKEKDLSASSSSLSLASGSSINGRGEGSSIGDADESGSSPATESEWSGPSGFRDKKENRRNVNTAPSGALPPRSLRSYHTSGSATSSRNSRTTSPTLTHSRSLYDPSQHQPVYDPSTQPHPPPHGYHHPHYMYPYPPPPAQGLNPPYMGPYGYYPPYPPYHHPPQHGDNNMHSPGEPYPPQPPMNYSMSYGWPHHPQPGMGPAMQPMQHPPPPPPPLPQSHHPSAQPPPPPGQMGQYPSYIPASPYNVNVPAGYYPPPQHIHPHPPPPSGLPSMHSQPQQLYDPSNPNTHMSHNSGIRPGQPNGPTQVNAGRNNQRQHTSTNNGGINIKSHGGQPPPPRSWTYGPPGPVNNGISYHGHVHNANNASGDVVGPRFNSTMRRVNTSGGSSSSNRPSHSDEVSSTSSSNTIVFTKRSYTSNINIVSAPTPSSQHPLPPRPDWAVGLKPQSTTHRLPDHNNPRALSPSSIPRTLNGSSTGRVHHPSNPSQQSQLPAPLQPHDFPPLNPMGAEKRVPSAAVASAWSNSTSRSLFIPAGLPNADGVMSELHNELSAPNRLEEADQDFERPPPKSSELFNPKIVRRPGGNHNTNVKNTNGVIVINEQQKSAVMTTPTTSSSSSNTTSPTSTMSINSVMTTTTTTTMTGGSEAMAMALAEQVASMTMDGSSTGDAAVTSAISYRENAVSTRA